MSYIEIKQLTLRACWKAVWPTIVKDNNNKLSLENEYSQIIEIGHTFGGEGFVNMTKENISKIVDDHEDDLIEMVKKILVLKMIAYLISMNTNLVHLQQ